LTTKKKKRTNLETAFGSNRKYNINMKGKVYPREGILEEKKKYKKSQ